jgi:hypothetical protein
LKKIIPMILILSLIVSMNATAQASMPPVKPGSAPGGKLYTEAEAEAAIDAAVDVAVDAVEKSKAETIEALKAALREQAAEAKKARAWTTAIGIGAAVLIPAAFIGGAIAWGALSD